MQFAAYLPLKKEDTLDPLAPCRNSPIKMYSNLVSAAPLALTTLFCFLFSPIRASNVPYSGETIAHLIASLDAGTASDPSYSTDANLNINGRDTSNANSTDAQHEATKRTYEPLQGKLFAASYNASDGNGGYNISIPGDICANSVVGDLEAPSGRLIPNATFIDVYNAMDLPSTQLTNYTLTRALALQSKLNTTLSNVICAPLPDRELRFRYDHADVDGFWSAFILAGLGVAGIGFAGLHEAIVRQSQGLITVNEEVWVLAATALTQYIIITIIFRLQHVRAFSRGEAFVFNTFIVVAEGIAAGCQITWSRTCAAAATMRLGIIKLARATVETIQGFEPKYLGSSGASSINLVGQDLEQGESAGEGQVCS